MAQSATRDPLEKFRFQVGILTQKDNNGIAGDLSAPANFIQSNGTKAIGGFHDVQMPKRTTTKGTYRQGNFPDVHMVFPGISTMEDIVLSRGLTLSTDFYQWASAVHNGADTTSSLKASNLGTTNPAIKNSSSFRADLSITMFNRDGSVARQWAIYNAFPVHFTPGSDLNAAEDGEKSMESLTLTYEDFVELTP